MDIQNSQNKTKKVEVDGVVIEDLQDTNYLVEAHFQGYKFKVKAYPGGKMRTYYRGRVMIGDKVVVEVDLHDISQGIIKRKLSKYPAPAAVAAVVKK